MSNSVSFKISPIVEFANNSFWKVFILVAAINLISTIIYNHLVWSDLIYLNESGLDISDGTFVSGNRSRLIVNLIVEVFSPFWLLFKSFVFSILIYSVGYLMKLSISFTELNKIFLVSYLFVIFGDFINSVLLLVVKQPSMKNDILHYYPFSVLGFLSSSSDFLKYYFVWSRINIFQLGFVFSVFYLFKSKFSLINRDSIFLVLSYILFYGLFLALWLLVSI
ncbi:hypothetical protein [Algoriphagus sp.]|uniref:hypothetical protein n=1 Tax=Algoriphagus sp. TaxID=1872435 RepID=UPI003918C5AC